MRIKEIKLNNFKRFTDLTIQNIPETAKLVVLVGPNGSGKTSLLEAFLHWYRLIYLNGALNQGNCNYIFKDPTLEYINYRDYDNLVNISFYNEFENEQNSTKNRFYFRTAYRNESTFDSNNLYNLSRNNISKKYPRFINFNTLADDDKIVSTNYIALLSKILSSFYDNENDNKKVYELRDELINKINNSLRNVFDDLTLTSIGKNPLFQDGSFYFDKGISKNFHYKNLSAGEKSAFDLILDLIINSEDLNDSIYVIDEPESHLHTKLQAKLLKELYNLTNDNSQLWISTHSIGMIKQAENLENQNPGTVAFLNFSDQDFDSEATLSPVQIDKIIWQKFIELTFADFSGLIAPETIVFCEGKNTDDVIYEKIFNKKYPHVKFISIGCSNDINKENSILSKLFSSLKIIKLKDRDDCSTDEIEEYSNKGIKVLIKRHLESYLFDDEIIKKLCKSVDKENLFKECIEAKKECISNSEKRDNPENDIKSASGEIYNKLKKILKITYCGNNKESFMRDTLAQLITEDTDIFK